MLVSGLGARAVYRGRAWEVRSAAYSGQNAADVRFEPYFSRAGAKLKRAEVLARS
jgi:hypothetical protein